jgi:hypothetical protein
MFRSQRDTHLQETHVTSAKEYVALAARLNGPIPSPVGFSYTRATPSASARSQRLLELRKRCSGEEMSPRSTGVIGTKSALLIDAEGFHVVNGH